MRNSYKQGSLTFILYKSPDNTWVAACRELGLVLEGDDPELLHYEIRADAQNYLKYALDTKHGEHLLNKDIPQEILDEFRQAVEKQQEEDWQRWVENIKQLLLEHMNGAKELASA